MENFNCNASMDASTNYMLQHFYTSLTQDLPLQTINTATMLSTYVNPQNIERMVQLEMERIKENCARKEEQYVEQMLSENPIIIERRTNATAVNCQQSVTRQQHQGGLQQTQMYQQIMDPTGAAVMLSPNDNTITTTATSLLPLKQQSFHQHQQQRQQQQRADACRRSRYNNKIKKAKTKYRHKYMSQKLLQSTQMFDCIQDLISQAESHLLAQGLTKDKLQQLRLNYGMDKVKPGHRQQIGS